jgi:hypothetical protein
MREVALWTLSAMLCAPVWADSAVRAAPAANTSATPKPKELSLEFLEFLGGVDTTLREMPPVLAAEPARPRAAATPSTQSATGGKP